MAVKEVKLCLLGDSGVGKSSIALRFVHDSFKPNMEATIGASFLTKTIHVDDRIYKYQIWDTAGQEKYRALAPMYYRGAAAAIVVYDITHEKSFTMLKSWITEIQRHGPVNIVLAIAGNKCDLHDLREVQSKDAQAYADSVGALHVETSAKSAINIAALFNEISKKLPTIDLNPRHGGGMVHVGSSQGTADSEQAQGKKCCS